MKKIIFLLLFTVLANSQAIVTPPPGTIQTVSNLNFENKKGIYNTFLTNTFFGKVTTAEMNAITTPLQGRNVYNTNTNTNWYYNGTVWVNTWQTPQVNSDWNATSGVAQILNKPLIQSPITATAPIQFNLNNLSITTASTTATGALSNTDWNTFNNKLATANNGLTATGTLVELGGTLTKNTNINQNGFNLTTTGSGNVGIGTSSPIGKLDIVSDNGGMLLFSRYGGQPRLILRRAQGTFASPTAVPAGASTVIHFDNFDGTNFGTSAQIQVVPGNITPTDKGASMALNVAISGTTSLVSGLIVSGSNTCAGCISITDNFQAASARLTIRPNTVFSPSVPFFDIKSIGGADLLQFSNAGNLRVGIGATDDAKLSVAGQVKITGGTPGVNKVLTSDAVGLATWQTITGFTNNTYADIITNVQYTGVNTTIATGEKMTGIYRGVTIYRFISNTTNAYGYPTEDSFYTDINLTTKITQRNQ